MKHWYVTLRSQIFHRKLLQGTSLGFPAKFQLSALEVGHRWLLNRGKVLLCYALKQLIFKKKNQQKLWDREQAMEREKYSLPAPFLVLLLDSQPHFSLQRSLLPLNFAQAPSLTLTLGAAILEWHEKRG